MAVTLVLFVCLCLANAQLMDLFEGDVCQQINGTLWTCKRIKDCPKAQEDMRINKKPQTCNFIGTSSEPVVCCEPSQPTPSNNGRKSKEMCKKYAKFVYAEFPAPVGPPVLVDTCAVLEPSILTYGGIVTDLWEYPHMALIGYGNESSIEWLCGGTLISERYVLSAAHCTHGGSRRGLTNWVRLGGNIRVRSSQDDSDGVARSVQFRIVERINHPEYKSLSGYNDIALYKLETDVVFNEYIRPICLQTEHQFPGTYAISTGWSQKHSFGKVDDLLMKSNITILPRKKCADVLQLGAGRSLKDGIRDRSMLCGDDVVKGKDTCQGNSGGALQLRLKDPYCMYSEVGIISFDPRCPGTGPVIYTRVSHYIPWIESIVWS